MKFFKKIVDAVKHNQICLYLAVTVLTFLEVEILNGKGAFFKIEHDTGTELYLLFLNLTVYFSIYMLVGVFSKKIKRSTIITFVIINIFAWVNNVLIQFRGTAFKIPDILSVKTAANVAGMYSVKFDIYHLIWAILFIFTIALIIILAGKTEVFSKKLSLLHKLAYTGIFLALLFIIPYNAYANMGLKNFDGYYVGGYSMYFLHAAVPNFIAEPENYSADKYETLTLVECSTDKRPNIIVIMNEAFCDLNRITKVEASEEPMPFFRELIKGDNIVEGDAYVSVFAGNTANSELEFLTGSTMGFWGEENLCYSMGYSSQMDILPYWLHMIGYDTYAMHPADGGNYGRKSVYQYMRFDNMWFLDDFLSHGAKATHYDNAAYALKEIVMDAEDYKVICDEIKNNEKPVFVFNTTIQNHGGYLWRGYNDVKLLNRTGNEETDASADEYLSLIKRSDDALKELVTEIQNSGEETILLFFGDHQPMVSLQLAEGKGEKPEMKEQYNTPYFIWANFDIEEKHGCDTSLNYLQNELLEQAGIGLLNDYQKNIEKVREKYPILSVSNTVDSQGNELDYHETYNQDELLKEYHRQAYHIIYDAQ